MCVLFLTLSFIARSINGYLLSYVLLLNFFFAPLLFSKLPTAYVQQIKSCLQTISTNEGNLLRVTLDEQIISVLFIRYSARKRIDASTTRKG